MSNLVDYAKSELQRMGYGPDLPADDPNRWMYDHLVKMVEAFSEEGHSGFSANYAVNLLAKLLRYEPLTPLTGDDDEWTDVSAEMGEIDGQMAYQNKRCFHVFKDENGKAYDIEGRIFVDPNGTPYTNAESRVYIEFPYVPHREYVRMESVE
jgi:hypothetical protein